MATNSVILFHILLFIFLATNQVDGLKCYTCTVNSGEPDQRCVSNPAAVESGQKIVNCNKEYCTIKRVEFKDPPNKVHSMHRNCESNPDQMNTIIEDDLLITYFTACRKDLCNGGSGKGSSDGGLGFDPETGDANVLYVKGINKAPGSAGGSFTVVGAVAVISFLIRRVLEQIFFADQHL